MSSTALGFFNGMLKRYPNRRLGATTLWAGANSLYYASCDHHEGEALQASMASWFQ